jgi:hypothetical protein
MSIARWKATHLVLLSALLGAGPALAGGKLSVLYQATADDGNAGSSLYQPLPVAGGGIIVEAQGGSGSYGLVLLLTPNGTGQPYTRTVLHNFNQPCTIDGGGPTGHLAADKDGNVWGMTNSSCGVPSGTVFELVKPGQGGTWTYKEVLQMPASYFQNIAGGGYDDILFDPKGNLYGLLRASCQSACSTVFEIPASTLAGGAKPAEALYSFPSSGNEAAFPKGLVRDKSGNLFGTQQNGGSAAFGAVWEVSPPTTKGGSWTGGTIYSFCTVLDQYNDCSDGAYPTGAPAIDVNGALYGTSAYYGAGPVSGVGVIWVMQPPGQGGSWSLSVIHELFPYYSGGGETPDYDIQTPLADTLLSKRGQVITEVNIGGWVGTKKNQVAVSGGGVLSVSPETQQDATVSKAFAAYGMQAGPLVFNSSLSTDSKGNLYGSSQQYYDPNANPTTSPAVIFEINP